MSARLIKRHEQEQIASFDIFQMPSTQAGGSGFLKTIQQRGPTTVTREDSAGAPPPFRPRPVNGVASQFMATSSAAAAPALERKQPRYDPALEQEAETIVTQARAQAEQIIAQAQASAAEIERQARERGLADAEATITIEAAHAVEPLREKLTNTLAELANLRPMIAARAERDLVRLALEIAKKVVHREVTMDHEIALTLARVALSRLHNRAIATVHLHPDDYNYVVMHRDKLGSGVSLELIEDRSIERGGCLVSTEMGDIDARIEQQFAEIERGFMGL